MGDGQYQRVPSRRASLRLVARQFQNLWKPFPSGSVFRFIVARLTRGRSKRKRIRFVLFSFLFFDIASRYIYYGVRTIGIRIFLRGSLNVIIIRKNAGSFRGYRSRTYIRFGEILFPGTVYAHERNPKNRPATRINDNPTTVRDIRPPHRI